MTWHVIRVRSKDAQKQLARTSLSPPNTTVLQKQVSSTKLVKLGCKIEIQNRVSNVMNHTSCTIGDKHYNRTLACAACHLQRLLTDVGHNFIDQPIELLLYTVLGVQITV